MKTFVTVAAGILLSLWMTRIANHAAAAPVITDVTSSKNELLMKGATPHLRFVDTGGDDYSLTVDGNVMRVLNLDTATSFFNMPPIGDLGIELSAPTSALVTPFTSGGSLPDGTYLFVVTALDGFGETVRSNEVSCVISGGGGAGRCVVSWTAVSPPTSSYRVYIGTGAGLESFYRTVAAPTVTLNYTQTSLICTALTTPETCCTGNQTGCGDTPGTPPDETTAYSVRLAGDGVHFPDGSVQSTASGSSAWAISGSDIISAQSGNVGIFNGGVFSPDAKLTVKCTSGRCVDFNDMGALVSLATNDVSLRSNYQNSDDTSWNTGQSSWSVAVGDAGDAFSVYRAPATAGNPVFAKLLSLSSTVLDVSVANETITSTNSDSGHVGAFKVQRTVSGTPFFFAGQNTTYSYLDSWNGVTADKISINSLGGQTAVGGVTFQPTFAFTINGTGYVTGDFQSAGNLAASGWVKGQSMAQTCDVAQVTISSATTTTVASVTVTTSGSNNVFVTGTINGYYQTNDANQREYDVSIKRSSTVLDQTPAGKVQITGSATVTNMAIGHALQDLDAATAGAHTYTLVVDTTTGTAFTGSDFLLLRGRICVHEIP